MKLQVSDGEEADAEWAYINIEGHGATVSGGGAVWHPVTLDFEGPECSETANNPNPFLDYRLNVTFTGPDSFEVVVPGFFAGDGQGGGAGDVWRCRFNPDQPGIWTYASEASGAARTWLSASRLRRAAPTRSTGLRDPSRSFRAMRRPLACFETDAWSTSASTT